MHDNFIEGRFSFSGAVKYTLSGALQTITSVAFNATDDLVLGTSADNATRIWHLGTGRLRVTSSYISLSLQAIMFICLSF